MRNQNGTFTIIDPPGSVGTSAGAINNQGQVVGTFRDSRNVLHGYLRNKNGTFTVIDAPSSIHTFAQAINNQGQVVGSFVDSSFVIHGYLRDKNGTFIVIDLPNEPFVSTWTLSAINDPGQILGTATFDIISRGFLITPR